MHNHESQTPDEENRDSKGGGTPDGATVKKSEDGRRQPPVFFRTCYYNRKGCENMDAANLANLIGSVGFPIVIAGYLIMRLDQTLDKQSDVLTRLAIMLDERLPHVDIDLGRIQYTCKPVEHEQKKDGGAA